MVPAGSGPPGGASSGRRTEPQLRARATLHAYERVRGVHARVLRPAEKTYRQLVEFSRPHCFPQFEFLPWCWRKVPEARGRQSAAKAKAPPVGLGLGPARSCAPLFAADAGGRSYGDVWASHGSFPSVGPRQPTTASVGVCQIVSAPSPWAFIAKGPMALNRSEPSLDDGS
jgi:hypothetical protein